VNLNEILEKYWIHIIVILLAIGLLREYGGLIFSQILFYEREYVPSNIKYIWIEGEYLNGKNVNDGIDSSYGYFEGILIYLRPSNYFDHIKEEGCDLSRGCWNFSTLTFDKCVLKGNWILRATRGSIEPSKKVVYMEKEGKITRYGDYKIGCKVGIFYTDDGNYMSYFLKYPWIVSFHITGGEARYARYGETETVITFAPPTTTTTTTLPPTTTTLPPTPPEEERFPIEYVMIPILIVVSIVVAYFRLRR